MTNEELVARLRVGVPTAWEKQAADRIETLVKQQDQAWEVAHAATDRGMRAEAEVRRLKNLLGRYAKHLAFTAPEVDPDEPMDPRATFHKTSPWVTWDELQEIESYADRAV